MVRLAANGKSLIDRAFAEDLLVERAMLSALGNAEREQLAKLLAKLLAYLERPQLLAIEFRMTLFGDSKPMNPLHCR